MNKKLGILALLLAAPLATATAQDCTVIDFETIPDGSPTTDLQLITNEYAASCGVTFELLGAPAGTGPLIAKVGPPRTAFQGPAISTPACGVTTPTDNDTPDPGASAGCSFLTDNDAIDAQAFTLRITYTDPVSQAGAILLDIDASEQWTITARDIGEAALETVVLNAGAGEGAATPVEFDLGTDVIKFIDMDFTGSGSLVGLAFDNFFVSSSPSAVGACCLSPTECTETSEAE